MKVIHWFSAEEPSELCKKALEDIHRCKDPQVIKIIPDFKNPSDPLDARDDLAEYLRKNRDVMVYVKDGLSHAHIGHAASIGRRFGIIEETDSSLIFYHLNMPEFKSNRYKFPIEKLAAV
ncbi:MAG: hypothetical protein WC795_02510 [Candidatus Paceibacterota bacterium]|jgi:hypothetical protein